MPNHPSCIMVFSNLQNGRPKWQTSSSKAIKDGIASKNGFQYVSVSSFTPIMKEQVQQCSVFSAKLL